MSKIMLPAAVLTAIGLFVCDDASAGWRRRSACCVPAPAVVVTPAPVTMYYAQPAPAPVAAAPSTVPPVASRPAAPTYRSYSYEPTPAYRTYVPARPYVAPLAPSQSHFFRADRKMHDPLWYRVQ
jgi:hypothetical protein